MVKFRNKFNSELSLVPSKGATSKPKFGVTPDFKFGNPLFYICILL